MVEYTVESFLTGAFCGISRGYRVARNRVEFDKRASSIGRANRNVVGREERNRPKKRSHAF